MLITWWRDQEPHVRPADYRPWPWWVCVLLGGGAAGCPHAWALRSTCSVEPGAVSLLVPSSSAPGAPNPSLQPPYADLSPSRWQSSPLACWSLDACLVMMGTAPGPRRWDRHMSAWAPCHTGWPFANWQRHPKWHQLSLGLFPVKAELLHILYLCPWPQALPRKFLLTCVPQSLLLPLSTCLRNMPLCPLKSQPLCTLRYCCAGPCAMESEYTYKGPGDGLSSVKYCIYIQH